MSLQTLCINSVSLIRLPFVNLTLCEFTLYEFGLCEFALCKVILRAQIACTQLPVQSEGTVNLTQTSLVAGYSSNLPFQLAVPSRHHLLGGH